MDPDTRRVIATGDPISKFHRDITGNAARVHVPLRDAIQLRHVAEHLVALAAVLRRLSHDTTTEQWRLLFMARQEIKATDAAIRRGIVPGGRKS